MIIPEARRWLGHGVLAWSLALLLPAVAQAAAIPAPEPAQSPFPPVTPSVASPRPPENVPLEQVPVILDQLGPVRILRDGRWHPSRAGDRLSPGQYLATGPGGAVWLSLGLTTTLHLSAEGQIGYRWLGGHPLVAVQRGRLQAWLHERTPVAVMTGEYYSPRLPEGVVHLEAKRLSWNGPPQARVFLLQGGHLVTIAPGRKYEFPAWGPSAQPVGIPSPDFSEPPPVAAASPTPLSSAAAISPIMERLTVPLPSPAPSAPVPPVSTSRKERGITWQLRSSTSFEYQSNVEEASGGTSGVPFHQSITAGLRHRFTESGAQLIANYSHHIFEFLTRANAFSFGLATMMFDFPLGEHADVYVGGMRLFKWIRGAPSQADINWFGGVNTFFYPTSTALVYGGYQFSALFTPSPATSYYGHTLQVGYRNALTERLLVGFNYSFQLRSAVLEARMSSRHSFGVDASYQFNRYLGLTLSAKYLLANQAQLHLSSWSTASTIELGI